MREQEAPAAVRRQVLSESVGRRVSYSRDHTVGQLIEQQAASRPEQVAVLHGDRMLTYHELVGAARCLAGLLWERGTPRGAMVPLLTGDGMELPVAMLASMLLACPFVPVDPCWPAARVQSVLAELDPPVVLVNADSDALTETGPFAERALPIVLDALREGLPGRGGQPGQHLPATVDELAYGFYTSGSTGPPKCALNGHLGLLNRVLYMSRRFDPCLDGDPTARHVVLQNSRPGFDSVLWQLLWPLASGDAVVIPEREGILDLARTVHTIARYRVTMTDVVPSVFAALVELVVADPALVEKLRSLRTVLIGGEDVIPAAVHQLRALLPGVDVVNTYGPTECSIGSVFHRIVEADGDRVPLGRPIDNTSALVLDDNLGPVRPGTLGEIYIGGDCVGHGYLNDPTRTAAAFVANPFPEVPGRVLYRTGDLGHRDRDGLLYFAGRVDDQVKVGGARVELAEVEAALRGYWSVRDCRVVLDDAGGERQLVACVVPRGSLDLADLRERASAALPAVAVPRRYLVVDSLPLTPNGKTDRRALTALVGEARDGPGPGARPGALSAEEATVAELWAALLGRASVHPDDDFAELGGTSLTAQRLTVALHSRFGVRISPAEVFQAPTVRALSRLVTGTRPAAMVTSAALRADVRLPEPVEPVTAPRAGPPRRVLLTGATGFLGAHLLAELLASTDAEVSCLVRAMDQAAAAARLLATLQAYRLYPGSAGRAGAATTRLSIGGRQQDGLPARVRVVTGDLSLPSLGLSEARLHALAEGTDAVLHSGALVNLVLDYRAHRPANVYGTSEMIRLAARAGAALHLVSTLSVFAVDHRLAATIGERARPDPEMVPADGYSQSKWVAEQLVAAARERGLPAVIYRLGEVTAAASTGVPSPRGLLDTLVAACVRLGMRVPLPARTDYTPADHAARAVVALLRGGLPTEPALHLFAPRSIPVEEVLDAVHARRRLRQVTYPELWAAVRQAAGRGEELLGRLLTVLPEPAPEDPMADQKALAALFTDAPAAFTADRARAALAAAGADWPELGAQTLGRYAHRVLAAVS